MTTETEFPEGIIFKLPNDKAPDYVKGRLSIKREEAIAWLKSREGEWVNLDLKVGQSGKPYAAVDNWKPDGERAPRQESRGGGGQTPPADDFGTDSIPF